MFYVLPLLALSSVGNGWGRASEPKLRAWAVMLLASAATYVIEPGEAAFKVYAYIDLIGALAVLSRPRNIANWSVGFIFSAMALVDIYYVFAGGDGVERFVSLQLILGWLQWGLLLLWGTHDAGRGVIHYFSSGSARNRVAQTARTAGQEP
ncbi:MAG: hypothetical protein V4696_07435 [Pseudomonadota bacterium]